MVPLLAAAPAMSAATETRDSRPTLFAHLPVGLFGSVMGLTGLSVAWRLAADRHGWGGVVADVLGASAVLTFIALGLGYIIKMAKCPQAVRAEMQHPSVGTLFGTILISLLLLPVLLVPISRSLAIAMRLVGAAGMIAFALAMVDRWLSSPQSRANVSPTWAVPVVGLLDVPLAVPALGMPSLHGTMVAALAIGLFFAVPLFTLIFTRLLFEAPLPAALEPTLLILVAPFAVGCSAYLAAGGAADMFAQSLLALAVFTLLVFGGRLRHLWQCCPFRFSWWAVSFPLAATSIAAFRVGGAHPTWHMEWLALVLLAVTTLVIAALVWRTLAGLARGEMRQLAS
jgi:tellurite resistance protein